MGNRQTTLPIKQYFEQPLAARVEEYKIIVHLDPPALGSEGDRINCVILHIHDDTLDVLRGLPGEGEPTNSYAWRPKSHMRDFEVCNPFSKSEIRIARDQGIGVVICEPKGGYVKLIYDKTLEYGVRVAVYSRWDHSSVGSDGFCSWFTRCVLFDI